MNDSDKDDGNGFNYDEYDNYDGENVSQGKIIMSYDNNDC